LRGDTFQLPHMTTSHTEFSDPQDFAPTASPSGAAVTSAQVEELINELENTRRELSKDSAGQSCGLIAFAIRLTPGI
jgi:hypothetical protein